MKVHLDTDLGADTDNACQVPAGEGGSSLV